MRNNILFIVDPQKSFLGYGSGQPYQDTVDGKMMTAELPVVGAVEDMDRLVTFIDSDGNGEGIDDIVVTLDTHETLFDQPDIGHPEYWRGDNGEHPKPFTLITYEDYKTGKWRPSDPSFNDKVENYLRIVGTQVVWPRHCVLGTWGHDVYGPLSVAIQRWIARSGKHPWVLRKGMNCHTEQYGAFEAAVPDPDDPATQFNWTLHNHLKKATRVWVVGIAKSHCVKTSVEQSADKLAPAEIARWTLLEDCMSSVTGFEAAGESFIADMRSRGMTIAKAAS